ncbi:MAG TPA: FUSC family protein, partial [Roseiarcus sp.]|nr:FUSC family protein [Roseiarcus sp.]
AALVCQPQLGASLRKASFRLIGTVVGAVAIVLLTAAFPQDRVGFLLGLALWGALCGFAAALLTNFAAYGAGLAGFTAAVLANDVLGATGGANDRIVTFAIFRAVEIGLGIVSAGVVLALTDFGNARRKLAVEFAGLGAEVLRGFFASLFVADPDGPSRRAVRRDLLRRTIALDPMIDTAIGEASDLRYRSRILQASVDGLFTTISAWRMIARARGRSATDANRREAERIGRELQSKGLPALAEEALGRPAELRDACSAAARALSRVRGDTPAMQLLADGAAEGMLGMARTLNGLTLIVDPDKALREDSVASFQVPDRLPAFVVALRAFLTIGAVSLFWIVTAWPNGALAITFATAVAILLSLQGDQAYAAAMKFLLGCCLSAVFAGILVLWLLPGVVTFPGLCLALALPLVPMSFFVALPWQPVFFTAAVVNLVPMLSLANTMTYDAQQFYNLVLAILVGIAAATVAIRLLPPPSPELRTSRLLKFALADLRRLARRRRPARPRKWRARAHARLVGLPPQAEPLQRAQLASILAVGVQIIRLREVAPRFLPRAAVEGALEAVCDGQIAVAIDRLGEIDRRLAALAALKPETRILRRLRASILAITQELATYPGFFEARSGP